MSAVIPVFQEIDNRYSEKGIWQFGDKFNLQNEVFIGMSPTNYHCFIVSGDQEFHPRFSFNAPKLLKAHKDKIRAGIFFRIKNLSPEKITHFQNYLTSLKDKRSPSCHMGVIYAVNKGLGIQIKDIGTKKIKPCDFFTYTLKNGLIDMAGNKVEFELYLIKLKSVEAVETGINFFAKKFGWVYVISDIYYAFLRLFSPQSILS